MVQKLNEVIHKELNHDKWGRMKKSLAILSCILLAGCTFHTVLQNGIEKSSDLSDSAQEASADVKADIPVSLTK